MMLRQLIDTLANDSSKLMLLFSNEGVSLENSHSAHLFLRGETVSYSCFLKQLQTSDEELKRQPVRIGRDHLLLEGRQSIEYIDWTLFQGSQGDSGQKLLFGSIHYYEPEVEFLKTKIQFLEKIINSVPHYFFWKDKHSIFLGSNDLFAQSAGLTCADEIIGLSDYDLPWAPADSASYVADDLQVMRSRTAKLNIEETQTVKGRTITLLTSKVPLFDDAGEIIGVLGIYSDISTRKDAEEELRIQKQRAEAADLAKSNFLAIVSHELRTPLNGVIGVTEVMRQNCFDAKTEEYLNDIEYSAKHLLNLVNDILDFSRLEADAMKIENKPIDIKSAFNTIAQNSKHTVEEKNLECIIECDDSIPHYISGDMFRIRQVMLNLINNAIKFTHEGSITIRLKKVEGQRYRFSVIDTGIGVSQEQQQYIFESFKQVDSQYNRNYEGVGLGLAICKQLVSKMNGDIGVSSSANHGAEFWFELPMVATSPAEPKAESEGSDIDKNKLYPYNVLLVEDNRLNQKIADVMLTSMGCEVDIADTGELAMDLFNKNNYDIIFMDIGLPDMDGITVTEKIREMPKDPNITIVGLSAHAFEEDIQRCFDASMRDVLTKPVTVNDFRELFERL